MKKSPKNNNKHWSEKDLEKLRTMSKTRPTEIIAYELGRSESSVRAKATKEKISLNPPNRSPYNRH